jgi:hypothetical protein
MTSPIKEQDIEEWAITSRDKYDQANSRICLLIKHIKELEAETLKANTKAKALEVHNKLQAKDVDDFRVKAHVAAKQRDKSDELKAIADSKRTAAELALAKSEEQTRRIKQFLKDHLCNNMNQIWDFFKQNEDL